MGNILELLKPPEFLSLFTLSGSAFLGIIFGAYFVYKSLLYPSFIFFFVSILIFLIGISSLAYLFYEE